MTLSGNEERIAVAEHCDSGPDREAAIADLDRAGRGGEDRGADGGGLLRARVIVGDDDDIGAARRDLAHLRPLARVAIAAAAEDDDQALAHEGAKRRERLFERIGL